MFSKSFWENTFSKVLAGLITTGIIAVITWVWPRMSTEYRIFLILGGFLAVVLTWVVTLTYKRIKQSINLRSGLVLELKDINCRVDYYKRIMEPRKRTESGIKLAVGAAIEIENRRRQPMTSINGSLKLILGKDAFDFNRQLQTFDLAGRASWGFFILFGETELKFPIKDPVLAPGAPYRLEFNYTYTVDGKKIDKTHGAKVSGKLSKSDWIGDPEPLWLFRRLGFPDPR